MERRVIGSSFDTVFEYDYSVQAEDMRGLYEKAKRDQWNASRDIAWDAPQTDDGRVLAEPLISARVPLARLIPDGLDRLEQRPSETLKIIIQP